MDVITAQRFAEGAYSRRTAGAGMADLDRMQRVADALSTPDERVVALLHHVLEGTLVKVADLVEAGVTDEQLAAILALTRGEREDDLAHLLRIASNPLAARVKLTDTAECNLPVRPNGQPADVAACLGEELRLALAVLSYRYQRWDGREALLRTGSSCSGEVMLLNGTAGWQPASGAALDAITGMGEDPWSCGESATPLTPAEADRFARAHGWELFGPGGKPRRTIDRD